MLTVWCLPDYVMHLLDADLHDKRLRWLRRLLSHIKDLELAAGIGDGHTLMADPKNGRQARTVT